MLGCKLNFFWLNLAILWMQTTYTELHNLAIPSAFTICLFFLSLVTDCLYTLLIQHVLYFVYKFNFYYPSNLFEKKRMIAQQNLELELKTLGCIKSYKMYVRVQC